MTRPKRRICVTCSSCDQLHYAAYDRTISTAVGPVASYVVECPVTQTRAAYLEDEEVQVP